MSTPGSIFQDALRDKLAKPMDPLAIAERIHNGNGFKYPVRGDLKRAHRAEITLRDAQIVVDYFAEGYYCPATATDPASYPVCNVKAVEIGGQDVTRLIGDSHLMEEIAEAVESSWVAA